jgi:hypothetical protein
MVVHTGIPALRRLWWEDHKFKTILAYLVRPCLQKKQNKNKQKKTDCTVSLQLIP